MAHPNRCLLPANARRSRRQPRVLRAAVALLIMVPACSDIVSTSTQTVPTNVVVDPTSFAGDVLCDETSSPWRSYVATLTDVTAAPALLPSSPPIPCAASVAFGNVLADHRYVGEIDGYDRPLCAAGVVTPCLTPQGGLTSGQRTMVDAGGAVIAPRWTTRCGDATRNTLPPQGAVPSDGPTVAADLVSVPLRACSGFSAASGGSRTTPTP